MKVWLLWDRASWASQDEWDTLLGIYNTEAGALNASEHASNITVQRSDGSTFCPYKETYRLEIECRDDINVSPSYPLSPGDGCRIIEPLDVPLEHHGPKTESQTMMEKLWARIEMDMWKQH